MRHFRGSRGSRRSSGLPQGSTRSVKYIVEIGGATEATGTTVATLAQGVDNTTLGQTGVTDTLIPVGSKITLFDIRMPKVNKAAGTANFVHWSLQRTVSGQGVINPASAGGNPLRKNIMLSGVLGLGPGQNNSGHIRYRVPKRFQRIGDGDAWTLVNNNLLVVDTAYEFVYKVFQ